MTSSAAISLFDLPWATFENGGFQPELGFAREPLLNVAAC
jgi:hypothetical protein